MPIGRLCWSRRARRSGPAAARIAKTARAARRSAAVRTRQKGREQTSCCLEMKVRRVLHCWNTQAATPLRRRPTRLIQPLSPPLRSSSRSNNESRLWRVMWWSRSIFPLGESPPYRTQLIQPMMCRPRRLPTNLQTRGQAQPRTQSSRQCLNSVASPVLSLRRSQPATQSHPRLRTLRKQIWMSQSSHRWSRAQLPTKPVAGTRVRHPRKEVQSSQLPASFQT
mmetsp:Transcript_18854/g.56964  ORF Transcript_18854/g.56964 Transcript_18854/m.56964 type:complete len:223 (-) Transcript_18854:2428-3096(-)